LSAIKTLLANSEDDFEDVEDREAARTVEALPDRMRAQELRQHCPMIAKLWLTRPIQEAYKQRARFQLVECAAFFLTRCESVLAEGYLPTDNDVVRCRVRTTGIVEHQFDLRMNNGRSSSGPSRRLVLIDVGGQRSERKLIWSQLVTKENDVT